MKYRHLGRKSSHRQALLRNLVTSLFTHESITTTWPKAKEAQRLAEKLITLGKKNTEASRRRALSIFYVCDSFTLSSIKILACYGSLLFTRNGTSLGLETFGRDISTDSKTDTPRAPPQALRTPARKIC